MGPGMPSKDVTVYELDGHEVRLSNPGKVYFPASGVTKEQLADYHVECAQALLNHLRERPTMLKRFPGGIETKAICQKRVPEKRPEWVQTCVLKFPSGRSAEELVPSDAAHLVWAVSLGNVDGNPHPVRRADLDHPHELRVDLDPMPDTPWDSVRRVALVARDVLAELGLRGYPKTSGSRGIHIPVRIEPRWDFVTVRRAALALAREGKRRAPGLATSKWWREERPPAACGRGETLPARSMGTRVRWSPCSTSRAATRSRVSATPPGHRTSPSSQASPSGCSRAGRGRTEYGAAVRPPAKLEPARVRRASLPTGRAARACSPRVTCPRANGRSSFRAGRVRCSCGRR